MSPERTAAEIYGRDFPAGAVVFEEGDPGSRMYVLVRGEVRIVKRLGARTLTLARLGPGEAFGEMALLEGQPRSAAAVVETDARLLEIDEAAFEDLVRNNGEVGLRLLRKLSARLRAADRQIRNFLSADAMARAVAVLRAVCGPAGEDGFRPIPPEASGARLAGRTEHRKPGESPEALWERLRHARLVREVGGHAELAPAGVVEAWLRYAELRARFEALARDEVAEVAARDPGDLDAPADEILHARLSAAGPVEGASAARDYEDFLALRARFEPGERERMPR